MFYGNSFLTGNETFSIESYPEFRPNKFTAGYSKTGSGYPVKDRITVGGECSFYITRLQATRECYKNMVLVFGAFDQMNSGTTRFQFKILNCIPLIHPAKATKNNENQMVVNAVFKGVQKCHI
eukprot:TRINITY_DN560_c0_g1_i21.p1 TRINITY_DN560_c0_g1~~TRINITY_DN560_c0_g1_i21.p1  ORF type:complete len:123 (-),score=1.22 TRINITY_DN560_c0_g1_i21:155-523(-)